MSNYLVTYDVREVDRSTYPGLYLELQRLHAVEALDSVYLLESELSAKALFERLMTHLTERTKLLVTEVGTANNWWLMKPEGAQWMQQRKL
jgi:hypothetical protein